MTHNQVTTQSRNLIPLPSTKVEVLAWILSDAFHEEPNFTYMIPDEESRRDVLPWFFEVAICAGQLYGEVHTTETIDGGAVWLSPGRRLTFWPMVRTGLLLLPFKVGWSGFWRMMNLNSRLDKVREQQVPEPHWYLMALGVAPSRQGQGIGSDLLQPILTHADAESQLCYLETFSERNLTFYERQGFEVQENGRIPHGGPAYWTMIHQPQA